MLACPPVLFLGHHDGEGGHWLSHICAHALAGLHQALLYEQADGQPDGAAGCAVGGGQLRLGRQLAARWQGADGDLFAQVRIRELSTLKFRVTVATASGGPGGARARPRTAPPSSGRLTGWWAWLTVLRTVR